MLNANRHLGTALVRLAVAPERTSDLRSVDHGSSHSEGAIHGGPRGVEAAPAEVISAAILMHEWLVISLPIAAAYFKQQTPGSSSI